jgi:hypothetical protein
MAEIDIGYIYRKYKMNCITRPKLYNSNYDNDCYQNKAALTKELLSNQNVDTIGVNVDEPEEWNIPDGKFHLLLDDLKIDKTQQAIQDIINKRYKAKHPILGNFTAGKTKRKRRKTKRKRKRGKTIKKQRKSYKNKI